MIRRKNHAPWKKEDRPHRRKDRCREERKEILKSLKTVSTDEKAYWLIDYWCGKDIRGLIQMPFSRHWIMHIEACLRIRDRIHPSGVAL